MATLVLATGNAKKGNELRAMVGDRAVVKTLADLGLSHIEIVEDAATFVGNARIKAERILAELKAHPQGLDGAPFAVLADDSGLVVDALAGNPGVRSARFAEDAGEGKGDADNNALLLKRLANVSDDARTARFHCAVVALSSHGDEASSEGSMEGRILRQARGAGGFGYDPLFAPEAYPDQTNATIRAEDKHAISHRGKAMATILPKVLGWLTTSA